MFTCVKTLLQPRSLVIRLQYVALIKLCLQRKALIGCETDIPG